MTDEDSRIMPMAGGSFEQACNAQAAVAAGSLLAVTADVVRAANDKQRIEPVPEQFGQLPGASGKAEALLADSGCFSRANVEAGALRKQTPEPVFSIIKSVMGFRQFRPRGLDKAKGERDLVTLAWNMKRMFVLQPSGPGDRTLCPHQTGLIPCNLPV